jgi:NAD(P)-dependent dehydrogenase (short-subunit alcohol dehydrogenase family)
VGKIARMVSGFLEELFSLRGLVAVVTGGSSGIGRAIAAALCGAGASVVLVARGERALDEAVGISKTEVGDSLDLLLGPLGTLGFCQPDGTFITTLDDLRELLGEMARSGEAVVVDGLATRVQRPRSWGNQKVLLRRQAAHPHRPGPGGVHHLG